MQYAEVRNGQVVGIRNYATPPEFVKIIDGAPVIRPLIDVRAPYNGVTHVEEGPVIDIKPDKVTRTWTTRLKTPEEIDAEKTRQVDRVERLFFEVLFDLANQVRALQGNPALTVTQFKTYLKGKL